MYADIGDKLFELSDPEYQKFASSLLPNVDNIIGVRLTELRKIAKGIAKNDWRLYLETCRTAYFEELMLKGMVIGYCKADIEEVLGYVSSFVTQIDNWSICDSFCSSLKFTKRNKTRVWNFIENYFYSNSEFEVRFAVVMLLNYYIDEEYIERVFKVLDNIDNEGYYARMAIAWAVSKCFVVFPKPTMDYLKNNKLDGFTYSKSLQKIIESNRIDVTTKLKIKELRER
jgi:3-methyladenine DNA glycosylase AlkD